MPQFPTLREFWPLITSEEDSIKYLIEQGVIEKVLECSFCGGNVSLHSKKWKCTANKCRKSSALFSNTFFSHFRLKVNDTLLLAYLWVTGLTFSNALKMSGHSSATVVEYFKLFRELVSCSLDEMDDVVGGIDVVVQVDESKFGKRKNNRGSHREGAWVIGGVEQTPEKKFFVEVVEKRDGKTIEDVLGRHILPGSIVHTDCWKGYNNIESALDVEHLTVNHSKSFINYETGVHTNSIEGKWAGLKRKITLRGCVSEKLPGYLLESIWRHRNAANEWKALLDALKNVYYE